MIDSVQKKYDERVKNYVTTINLGKPSEIIIENCCLTGQLGFAGIKVLDCYADPEAYVKGCMKYYETIPVDCCYNPLTNVLEAIWALGRKTYFVSDDGVTVQHHEDVSMEAEDYPALIENPKDFYMNVLFPRKFPILLEKDGYETFKKAVTAFRKQQEMNSLYARTAKETFGVISQSGAKSYPPFDIIFDRLRGFPNTMADVRRYRSQIKDACEALLPMSMEPLDALTGDFPHALTTIHSPAFLRTKDFEELFWPTYERMLKYTALERHSKTEIRCEGSMLRYFDLFNDLPKASLIVRPEADDPIEAYDKLKGHHAMSLNYPMAYMRSKSKEENADLIKKYLDHCARDGGLLMGGDLTMVAPNDVNVENLVTVYSIVKSYK